MMAFIEKLIKLETNQCEEDEYYVIRGKKTK